MIHISSFLCNYYGSGLYCRFIIFTDKERSTNYVYELYSLEHIQRNGTSLIGHTFRLTETFYKMIHNFCLKFITFSVVLKMTRQIYFWKYDYHNQLLSIINDLCTTHGRLECYMDTSTMIVIVVKHPLF